ncbi:superoxide dismutase [Cu-Zn] A-like [Dermatophagoides pteronyssinus]|uniref:superoxide dismutase [Cu-Zn] A-like n=1 Tax=Dermatophagoides pteronyssinus TaxID=6956 RepID=UPI003F667CC0
MALIRIFNKFFINLIIYLIFCCFILTRIANQIHLPTFEDLDIKDLDIDTSLDYDPDGGGTGISQPVAALTGLGTGQDHGSMMIKAVALIRGQVNGVVRLVQVGSGPTLVAGIVKGLYPFSKHGFHVHEYRVTGDCESAGEHYNPTKENHGSPFSVQSHVGDFGNLIADGLGFSRFHVTNPKLSLRGKYSVIERSLVIHQRPDDLGMGFNHESRKTGNSGGRLGCGTIKFVSIG